MRHSSEVHEVTKQVNEDIAQKFQAKNVNLPDKWSKHPKVLT